MMDSGPSQRRLKSVIRDITSELQGVDSRFEGVRLQS